MRGLAYRIRYFFQRLIRGFDDSVVWGLDHTILEFILPRLKHFRKIGQEHSWPGPHAIFDIDWDTFQALPEAEQEDLNERSQEEWDRMLGKMIRAIELQIEHGGIFLAKDEDGRYVQSAALEAEYKEGWDLFIEWFHALWT